MFQGFINMSFLDLVRNPHKSSNPVNVVATITLELYYKAKLDLRPRL